MCIPSPTNYIYNRDEQIDFIGGQTLHMWCHVAKIVFPYMWSDIPTIQTSWLDEINHASQRLEAPILG